MGRREGSAPNLGLHGRRTKGEKEGELGVRAREGWMDGCDGWMDVASAKLRGEGEGRNGKNGRHRGHTDRHTHIPSVVFQASHIPHPWSSKTHRCLSMVYKDSHKSHPQSSEVHASVIDGLQRLTQTGHHPGSSKLH